MTAATLNLEIEQGATFSQVVAAGVSYAGQQPRAQLRRSFADAPGGPLGDGQLSALLLADFAATVVDSGGNTTISLTATQTALLRAPRWTRSDERKVPIGVWELVMVSGDTITRTHQGDVKLSRQAYA